MSATDAPTASSDPVSSLHRYCVPTVVLSYLYIHTSRELRPPDGPNGIMLYEARVEARLRQR